MRAGTYAAASAITRGDVLLKNCMPRHLDAVISKLRDRRRGYREADSMRVNEEKGRLKASDVKSTSLPRISNRHASAVYGLNEHSRRDKHNNRDYI